MFSESISQASSCLSDVYLVAGTTFDEIYHVVACTGVLDVSPRSVDRKGKGTPYLTSDVPLLSREYSPRKLTVRSF